MSKVAGALAVVGGIMLVLGGFTGSAMSMLDSVKGAVTNWMPDNPNKDNVILVLTIMIYIALFGGFAVILGGYLMWRDLDLAGKILVWLGTGVGAISLILAALEAYATGRWSAFATSSMTIVGIGLLLSIVARWIA